MFGLSLCLQSNIICSLLVGTAGSVIGGLFILVFQYYMYYIQSKAIKLNYNSYSGFYAGYYIRSITDDDVIKASIKIVRRFFFTRPKVEITMNDFSYKGRYKVIGDTINICLNAKKHPEEVHMVLFKPVCEKILYLKGTFSSITEDKVPFAGKIIWVKRDKVVEPATLKTNNPELSDIRDFILNEPTKIVVKP